MSKYIDADKLIAEIERRRKAQLDKNGNAKNLFCAVRLWAYADLLRIIDTLPERAEYENCGGVNSKTGASQEVQELIDSLQQEQLEVDLEKEIERIVENEERFMKFQVKEQLIKYVARHFAEWGAIHFNARKEE